MWVLRVDRWRETQPNCPSTQRHKRLAHARAHTYNQGDSTTPIACAMSSQSRQGDFIVESRILAVLESGIVPIPAKVASVLKQRFRSLFERKNDVSRVSLNDGWAQRASSGPKLVRLLWDEVAFSYGRSSFVSEAFMIILQ